MTDNPNSPRAVRRFFGALLMAVGGLMAALCGLCTAAMLVLFVVSLIADRSAHAVNSDPVAALITLAVGGVPTLIGIGLFLAGRAMRRP